MKKLILLVAIVSTFTAVSAFSASCIGEVEFYNHIKCFSPPRGGISEREYQKRLCEDTMDILRVLEPASGKIVPKEHMDALAVQCYMDDAFELISTVNRFGDMKVITRIDDNNYRVGNVMNAKQAVRIVSEQI